MSDQVPDKNDNEEEEQITIGEIVETDTTYKLSVHIEKSEKSDDESN